MGGIAKTANLQDHTSYGKPKVSHLAWGFAPSVNNPNQYEYFGVD